MLKNYFKTVFRSIWRNKTTSAINLFGLSVGMTAAVFIFLWVQNEVSYDDYHPAKNRIYRITNSIQVNKDEAWRWETSPLMLTQVALQEIPEIELLTKAMPWGSPVMRINNKLFSEKTTAWVDKNWFAVFKYEVIAGNTATFGQNPFSIILTESKAKKYYGNENPVGKVILVDTVGYTVQAVIKDNPANSSFGYDVLYNIEGRYTNPKALKNDQSWGNFNFITFLQLKPGANIKRVEDKLNDILDKNRKENTATASLRALPDMYFESDLQSSNLPHGNKQATLIFGILGLLLLVTACINYVNLTTAKASLRAKEVSIRKITGAKRGHLFAQFIAESLIMSLIALVVTYVLLQLLLPVFNSITEKQFVLPFTSATMWRVLLGTLLFATILNGIYPALLLSSFSPLNVFRGKSVLKLRDGGIRKGLVVFQFTLSMMLIMGTIVIYRQLRYIQTSDPGYNVSQIMSINIPYSAYGKLKGDDTKSFFNSIRQELQSKSSIAAVSMGGSEIVNIGSFSSGNADWDGRDTTFDPTITPLSVDTDFQNMFRLTMVQGRWFMNTKEDEKNYILNETAAATFGMRKPIIGQRFTWQGDTGRVIGIVKDFHYKSLHEKIGPVVLSHNGGMDAFFFIKTVPANIPKAIAAAEQVWTKFIPNQPFSYKFLDDSFDTLYKTDIKTANLLLIFASIVVIISGLGLVALAAFTTEQRVKEIGIRKVLGASVSQITTLLSKDFVKLVAIAIVIASPLAWWAMNKWLEDFAYRINIGAGIFIIAGSLALLVALASVSIQAIKAALANPTKALRSE